MPIIEGLVANTISAIMSLSAGKAWKSLRRNEKVLKVLEAVDLMPDKPKPEFDSVYVHTLITYGVEKPEPVLLFFRHKEIQNAYEQSYKAGDFSILTQKAEHLIRSHKIGDELRKLNIDPRLEFDGFSLVFNQMVGRSRTPAEVRREEKLDQILCLLQEGNPEKIREKSLEMIRGSFADQLKEWFKTLGYGYGGHLIDTSVYSEWIIKIPARRGFDTILVRCMDGQAEAGDIESVKAEIDKHQADEAWLIAAHRKSKSACDLADKEDLVFCFTFDELLDERADFSRYFDWLETYVKEHGIDTDYLPLACRRDIIDSATKEKTGDERYGEKEGWIEGYIDRWLDDPCKEHISILGEFGTGKTWFTHHYAYELMKRYIEAKEKGLKRPRLPLVIQLRDYAKALNSESLFSDFFFRRHEIPLRGYSAFEYLNRMGKLLLIFDGFDEMADKLDRQKMINNFWELARVVVPGTKAILTCRTEHFPNAKEGRNLLNAELLASTRHLTGDPPQFEILDLEKFDETQIRAALQKRTDPATVEIVMRHQELLDLAARPVMLEFILEALPDIERGRTVDLSRIYLYAISAKLDRDIRSERTFTSMADKLFFMCELAWEMISTDNMSLNYRLFPERLKTLFGPVVGEEKDLDHWHHDMMGNTLLIRNDDGDYSPAHRSLLEFFVAYKAVAETGFLPSDLTAPARNQSNIDAGSSPKDYTWNSYFHRETDNEGNISRIPPLKGFRSQDIDIVLDSLGRTGDAVLRFIHEITNVEETRSSFHEMLSDEFEAFRVGIRDPEKQQNIILFILRFRLLSQQLEVQAGQGDFIRGFWKNRLEKEIDSAKGRAPKKTDVLEGPGGGSMEIDMVQVPAGSFLMGDEMAGPIHRVDITKPFLVSSMPVTQGLYRAIIGKNPSGFKGDELPVENVSWEDAVQFCNALSKRDSLEPAYRIDGKKVSWDQSSTGYRLPTEAEWEYVCRAGTTTCFACGDLESELEAMAWYVKTSRGKTHPVGEKEPNAWGLFDMHGNVWEWVWDGYASYPGGATVDPVAPEYGDGRVIRGGSWGNEAHFCRSAVRLGNPPGVRVRNVGFRLSRSVTLDP